MPPRDRTDVFVTRLRQLCAEAGLPEFDRTEYEPTQAILVFLWSDPEFCLAAPIRTASVYGLDAATLRATWDRKFGVPDAA